MKAPLPIDRCVALPDQKSSSIIFMMHMFLLSSRLTCCVCCLFLLRMLFNDARPKEYLIIALS